MESQPIHAVEFRDGQRQQWKKGAEGWRKRSDFLDATTGHVSKRMVELAKADLRIVRDELPRSDAIELFRNMGENYKVEIIEGIPEEKVSLYRQGDWVDLCRGPHVPSTAAIKAFNVPPAHSRAASRAGPSTRPSRTSASTTTT